MYFLYGGYYPSDEEIADDQAHQQWYDDQVQWGIEQGYIDPNTGEYTGKKKKKIPHTLHRQTLSVRNNW